MNPREALAALYSAKWAYFAARTNERPDAVSLCQHYHEKAAYWSGIENEAEAKPKTSTATPIF